MFQVTGFQVTNIEKGYILRSSRYGRLNAIFGALNNVYRFQLDFVDKYRRLTGLCTS